MRRLRKNVHAKGVRAIILFAGGGGCPRLIFNNFHYVNIVGLNFLEAGGYEPSPSLELPPPLVSAHLRWINAPLLLSWSASSHGIRDSLSFSCLICYMRGSRFFNELGLRVNSLIKLWQWPNCTLTQRADESWRSAKPCLILLFFQDLGLIGGGGVKKVKMLFVWIFQTLFTFWF